MATLKRKEMPKYCGCCDSKISELIRKQHIPIFKIGSRVYSKTEWIDKWMEAGSSAQYEPGWNKQMQFRIIEGGKTSNEGII